MKGSILPTVSTILLLLSSSPVGEHLRVRKEVDKRSLSVERILKESGILAQDYVLTPQSKSRMTFPIVGLASYLEQLHVVKEWEQLIRVRNIFSKLLEWLKNIKEFEGLITDLPWEVFLLDRKGALPWHYLGNGKITMSLPFLLNSKLTDDEIAGILWHEIGHSLRYRLPIWMYNIRPFAWISITIFDKQVSMESIESEPDLLGMIICYAAGYDIYWVQKAIKKSWNYGTPDPKNTYDITVNEKNIAKLLDYFEGRR